MSNYLINKRPDLLTEWDYAKNNANNINVNKITTGSGLKAWWLCSKCKVHMKWRSIIR